jgi:hypothetical protein
MSPNEKPAGPADYAMGFSAAGGLMVDVALKHDAESRPNFAAPIYPAIPREFQVPADAPPLFIAAASDEPLLKPVQHSVRLYTPGATPENRPSFTSIPRAATASV